MSLIFLFNIIDIVFFYSIIAGIIFIALWFILAKFVFEKKNNNIDDVKPFEEAKEEILPFEEAKDDVTPVEKEDDNINPSSNEVSPIEVEEKEFIEDKTEKEENIEAPKNEDIILENENNIKSDEIIEENNDSLNNIDENDISNDEILDKKKEDNEAKIDETEVASVKLFDDTDENDTIVDSNDNLDVKKNDELPLDDLNSSKNEEKSDEEKDSLSKDTISLDDIEAFDEVNEKINENETKEIKKLKGVVPVKKGRTYNGKYEIYQAADGYSYRLKASNGEILVESEPFISHDGALKAIDAVKRNITTGEVKIFKDKNGNYKFKLTSKNYRVLAISNGYSVEKSAIRALESFKKFALKADICDIDYVENENVKSILMDIKKDDDLDGAKFIYQKFNGEYSWSFYLNDNTVLCESEGYTTKNGVLYAIDTFKKNVLEGEFRFISGAKNNYYFRLYNQAGRILVTGMSYNSKDEVYDAVKNILNYSSKAIIKEKK